MTDRQPQTFPGVSLCHKVLILCKRETSHPFPDRSLSESESNTPHAHIAAYKHTGQSAMPSRLLETFTFNLQFKIPSGNTSQLKNAFPKPLVSFLTFHLSYYVLFRRMKWQLVSLKAMDTLFVNEMSSRCSLGLV